MEKPLEQRDVVLRGVLNRLMRIIKMTPQAAWFGLAFIVIIAPIIYQTLRHQLEARMISDEQDSVRLIAHDLNDTLYSPICDLLIGAEFIGKEDTHAKAFDWRQAGQSMRLVSRHKHEYNLYRIFDMDGHERIVYNNDSDTLIIAPDPRLHDRSGRYFLQNALKLNRNELYVSPLDLLFNRETNKVYMPLHPTVRIGVPIFDKADVKIGLLMINLNGDFILNHVLPSRTQGAQISLLNEEGWWLKSSDPADDWGWQMQHPERRFSLRHAAAWRVIGTSEDGIVHLPEGVFVYSTTRPLQDLEQRGVGASMSPEARARLQAYHWKVVSYLPRDCFKAAERSLFWWCFSLQIMALLGLGSVVWWQIRQRQTTLGAEMDLQQKAHLLDLAQDAIFVLNAERRIIYWNDGATIQYGWNREEAIGRTPDELLKTTYRDHEDKILETLRRTGRWEGEVTHRARNNERIECNCRLALQKGGEDEPPLVLAINHDITQRKRNLEALERASNENALFFESVPSLLIALDGEGYIVRWNRAAQHALGLEEDVVLGKNMAHCGVTWLDDDFEMQLQECLHNGGGELRRLRFMRDNETCFLNCNVLPLAKQEGGRAGFLMAGEDVTERLGLEQQLRQAQKMEAIGQLAAGIAHEINTPTQYVGDNTIFLKQSWESIDRLLQAGQTLRQELENNDEHREACEGYDHAVEEADLEYIQQEIPRALDQTLEGVHRVAKIVRAMKEFSHPGAEDKKAIDLNHAIETTVTVARNEWKYVSEVQMDFDPNLPAVECLAGEFNQVMLNLLVNAAYAIGEKNRDTPEIKGMINISTLRDEGWAEIRISDTGGGIPEAIQHRIFEPFFTTKDVGKGTGQGLAFAHAVIVKKHGGKIWFECVEGVGTTFVIRIPITSGEGASDDAA